MNIPRDERGPQAKDRLVQQDRVQQGGIILPTDKALTDEQHAAVREAVREYVTDDHGTQMIPWTQLGSEVGLSPVTICEYMKGKYKGNNDRVAKALNLWLDRHVKRERSQGPSGYIHTWVAEEMAAFVRLADRRQKMAAIVSPSGSGKDMVIEALAEELQGAVVYCDASTTATRLIQAIAEAIGLPVIRDTHTLQGRVVRRLKDRNTILFVNEAQQLARRGASTRCASILRSIYDQTGVPVVMFGSAEIFRFIDDRDPGSGGGQLYRRCLKVNMLNRAAEADDPDRPGGVGRPLFSKDEVRAFLAMKQVKFSGDGFVLLWQLANLTEHGTLGLCGDVVDTVADLWPEAAITREHIFGALSLLLDAEAELIQGKIAAAEAQAPRARAAAG